MDSDFDLENSIPQLYVTLIGVYNRKGYSVEMLKTEGPEIVDCTYLDQRFGTNSCASRAIIGSLPPVDFMGYAKIKEAVDSFNNLKGKKTEINSVQLLKELRGDL